MRWLKEGQEVYRFIAAIIRLRWLAPLSMHNASAVIRPVDRRMHTNERRATCGVQ